MPIRETFWNIPHWAEIAQYVGGFLAILICAIGVFIRVQHWRKGQPERRTDHPGKRLISMIVHSVAQPRILQDTVAGIMHLAIFWGMVALLVGTILATADWDVTHLLFGFQFLGGTAYVVYELILDIFGLLLIVGLGLAVYRRYVARVARLQAQPVARLAWDDVYVLVMLILVAISGYLIEGLRIAVMRPAWAAWSPVGSVVAALFLVTGDPTNRTLHVAIWVFHATTAFVTIASIPYTKLSHLVITPLNIFFRSFEPPGTLAPARHHSGPGVSEWHDFTWKQLLDFDACVRCGRCQDQCPAYASGSGVSPRNMMIKLSSYRHGYDHQVALHGGAMTAQEIWACTTCTACSQVCPAFTDLPSAIVDMRRHLVYEGQIDTRLQDALDKLGRYGNSFGQSERARARWTQSVQPSIKDASKEPVETLWFVGDYASYNAGLTDITYMTAEVFHRAGLDFGVLFSGERNSGNDVRRVGEEGLFEMLLEDNTRALSEATFDQIVTTDPHSYNALKNEYPDEAIQHRPVLHYAELLDRLIASGQLQFSKQLNYAVTYHDPCYLGRYNNVYDAPRRVIEATGCKLVEMPRSREHALCCGAGGGRIWMEEGQVKERPSEARIREAAGLDGVEILVTACPKDITMYRDAVKTTGFEDQIQIKDLIELVNEAL